MTYVEIEKVIKQAEKEGKINIQDIAKILKICDKYNAPYKFIPYSISPSNLTLTT